MVVSMNRNELSTNKTDVILLICAAMKLLSEMLSNIDYTDCDYDDMSSILSAFSHLNGAKDDMVCFSYSKKEN